MKRLIVFMLGVLSMTGVYGKIISTNSLSPLMQACVQADHHTLVIFDIDDVLVAMIDAIFQTNERYEFFTKHLNAYVQKDWMYDVWQDCSLCLVDKEMLTILKFLRNNSIPTLALTFGCAGSKGHHKNFERIRYERLKQLGIEFDWSFKDQPIEFKNVALNNENPPLFDKGILHSCGVAKSKVLESFLEHINYWPKSIIFVDDMMFNIEDLREWCASKGIIYQGFHYTGLELLVTEFSQKRALIQINHLINHGVWLTDAAADALM